MKTIKNKIRIYISILLGISISLTSQVKIGNNANTINVNSLLELESTNKGLLPPRVALNSLASVSPLTSTTPEGMLVYSSGGTLPNGYYLWNGTKWLGLGTSATIRNNFVLVKSVSDFPAAVSGVITLVAGTFYEINGTITLSDKIDLNGCNVQGDDGTNDKLIYTGSAELFTGSNTGSLTYLTLSAPSGKVFNINAAGALKNFVMQNCFVLSCNTVGTIQGIGGSVLFENVVFVNNTNGITFQNDFNVVLNNSLWNASNFNIYEKFTGGFNVIQIVGGVRGTSSANTATALSVGGITSIAAGTIKVVTFLGSGTFVSGSFSNFWEVESSGLNTEKDDVASGNIYISTSTPTTFTLVSTPTKVLGTTTAASLFRVTSPTNSRLTYTGIKTRRFMVICSLSYTVAGNNHNCSFYVAKNGVKLNESEMSSKISTNGDQDAVSLSCTVSLATNDYIEVWCENNTDISALTVVTMNLAIK